MKVILLNGRAASRTLELGKWSWALISACFIGLPLGLVTFSYQVGFSSGLVSEQATRLSAQELQAMDQAESLAQLLIELFPEKHREFTRDFNNGVIRI